MEPNELTEKIIGAAIEVGLLVNFNVPVLTKGVKRMVSNLWKSVLCVLRASAVKSNVPRLR
jgi:hypothetical protein